MNAARPDLSNLTPAQRLHWHVSDGVLSEALKFDATQLPPQAAMIFDRMRNALADALKLMAEQPSQEEP